MVAFSTATGQTDRINPKLDKKNVVARFYRSTVKAEQKGVLCEDGGVAERDGRCGIDWNEIDSPGPPLAFPITFLLFFLLLLLLCVVLCVCALSMRKGNVSLIREEEKRMCVRGLLRRRRSGVESFSRGFSCC